MIYVSFLDKFLGGGGGDHLAIHNLLHHSDDLGPGGGSGGFDAVEKERKRD